MQVHPNYVAQPRGVIMGQILTLRQVADYLKVHKNTIYRLVMRNQLPAFKVGHDWRFDSDLLDRWRQDQELIVKNNSLREPPRPRKARVRAQ